MKQYIITDEQAIALLKAVNMAYDTLVWSGGEETIPMLKVLAEASQLLGHRDKTLEVVTDMS